MLSIGNNTSVGSNYTQQAKQQTETSMTVEQKILKYFLQPCCLPVADIDINVRNQKSSIRLIMTQ